MFREVLTGIFCSGVPNEWTNKCISFFSILSEIAVNGTVEDSTSSRKQTERGTNCACLAFFSHISIVYAE